MNARRFIQADRGVIFEDVISCLYRLTDSLRKLGTICRSIDPRSCRRSNGTRVNSAHRAAARFLGEKHKMVTTAGAPRER
jgi:hypothetical protein